MATICSACWCSAATRSSSCWPTPAAVARQLSGLVADNEAKLAPTLDKLNSVAAMLEKNRDNLVQGASRPQEFEITSGETVSNGSYYSAFVPNLSIPEFLQPFFDYYFGFRRGDPNMPRALFPWPHNGIPGGSDEPTPHGSRSRRRLLAALIVALLTAFIDRSAARAAAHDHHRRLHFGHRRSIPATMYGCPGSKSGRSTADPSPRPGRSDAALKVDHDVPIPADAKAVIVAQNLVAARYVQLTPAYHSRDGGPTMRDGAVIPRDRTAVPVEWDEVKAQLTRLATDLGPTTHMLGDVGGPLH